MAESPFTDAPLDEDVPVIVADFEFEGHDWLVVLWPADRTGEGRWQVYQADFPWYWKSKPYKDIRV